MIARIRNWFAQFRHTHQWRKARKSEDASLKFCACGETREVKRRKKEAKQ